MPGLSIKFLPMPLPGTLPCRKRYYLGINKLSLKKTGQVHILRTCPAAFSQELLYFLR
jgi:hypothetical protein